ncbi:hypothetical protein [Desulfovibrio sp. ZJ369]|uniref:MotE family protein n=1 Tax=Desulfovibrio sp. ZJ369 TaxID=2709793 RepID=UPI0013E9A77C|nr:hypothetical protein [Desulfovibrio sp. ZJ369]
MTKQRPSATRLRLSRLFRWLAVLCFIKLSILGMLMLDLPLPAWLGGNAPDNGAMPTQSAANTPTTLPDSSESAALAEASLSPGAARLPEAVGSQLAPQEARSSALTPQNPPQGAAAAQLAATAKPRRAMRQNPTQAALPAPLVTAQAPAGGTPGGENVFIPPSLPEPAALDAPTVEPGTSPLTGNNAPLPALAADRRAREDGWLDVLGLTHLPVPGLGSVQAAHAAALDMPVPQTPASSASPFAPAEQNAPLAMPGAPDIPANIPRGQGADGAPLPPRAAGADSAALPALPRAGQSAAMHAPAPSVAPTVLPEDPNAKALDLARQQQDILMLRQQMDQRLKDLENAERKVKDMLREAKGLEDKKIHSLIQMYANMKPRTAAKALENMDERVAIRILSGMAPKQSGEILTYTNPAKTAKLTELITRMRLPE